MSNDYENPCFLQPEEDEDDSPSASTAAYNWWPPGFLGEREPEGVPETESAVEPQDSAEDQEKLLGQKLAHSYRIIDSQREDIRSLRENVEQLEEEQRKARQEVQTVKRRYRTAVQLVLGIIGLIVVLILHREICQVGWNVFHGAAAILNISTEDAVGFLTFLAAVWAMGKIGKWTYRAALEDLFGEEGGSIDDMGDW